MGTAARSIRDVAIYTDVHFITRVTCNINIFESITTNNISYKIVDTKARTDYSGKKMK